MEGALGEVNEGSQPRSRLQLTTLIMSVVTVVVLLITLALALTLVVRSCEFGKQARADIQITQHAANANIQKGQLVSVSAANGTLFPIKCVTSTALVLVEPPALAQCFHQKHLIEIVHSKFCQLNKCETGLWLRVRKFQGGLFAEPRTNEDQIVPNLITINQSPIELACSGNHIIVHTDRAVAVFECDWAQRPIVRFLWQLLVPALGTGVVHVKVQADLTIQFTLNDGSCVSVTNAGVVKPKIDDVSQDGGSGGVKCVGVSGWWRLMKDAYKWHIVNFKTQETIQLRAPLSRSAVVCATLSESLLVFSVQNGGVWFASKSPEDVWGEFKCISDSLKVHSIVANDQQQSACFVLALRGGGVTALVFSSKNGQTSPTTVSSTHNVLHAKSATILTNKQGEVVVAIAGAQGVHLLGNVTRWVMQPNTQFLGLVVKRNNRTAFVVRKGSIEVQSWMPPELSPTTTHAGMLILDTNTNTITKSNHHHQSHEVTCVQVCAKLSSKKFDLC